MDIISAKKLNLLLEAFSPKDDAITRIYSMQEIILLIRDGSLKLNKNRDEIQRLIDKLANDKYIAVDENRTRLNSGGHPSHYKYYSVTFDGEQFIRSGGYLESLLPNLYPAQKPTTQKRSRTSATIQKAGLWIISHIAEFIVLVAAALVASYLLFKWKIPH